VIEMMTVKSVIKMVIVINEVDGANVTSRTVMGR
jgi:hypothetical protein